jgi:hypothetical protein
MPDVNVYEAFKELIQRLLSGDQEVAELAASDPEGLLAAYGITDGNLDGVDFRQAVDECYHDYELPEGSKQALQSYVAGGAAPDHYQVKTPPAAEGHQTPEHAVQHLQYVTYATYETNETVTREIVNQQFTIDQSDNRSFAIDNSTDIGIGAGSIVDGDINVAPTTAAGDGAVANTGDDNVFGTGEGDVLSATRGGEVTSADRGAIVGDENIRADGDGDVLNATRGSEINAATGDGAVQGERVEGVNTGEFEGALAGRDVDGATNTGRFDGVQAGDDVRGAVNTGENTGVNADGRVEGTVVGDDNQTANLDIRTGGGSGGDASGTGGDVSGGGGFGDARFDSRDEIRDVDGSVTAGDGTGGTGGDGGGGDVGPINLNFGSGDQTNTGDVRDSAVATGGDATNDQSLELGDLDPITRKSDDPSAGELLRGLLDQEQAQDAEPAPEEETDVEILPVPGPNGQLEEEFGQEITQLEEVATASSQEDDASLGV